MFINNKIKLLTASAAALSVLLITSPNHAMADHASCPDLHAAAFLDEPNELSILLHHGVDLNCRDSLEQTPLITATDGASMNIVRMLLTMGVSVNARDEIGETALAKARHKFAYFDMKGGESYRQLYRDMIDLLEKAGATE